MGDFNVTAIAVVDFNVTAVAYGDFNVTVIAVGDFNVTAHRSRFQVATYCIWLLLVIYFADI